MKFFLPSLVLLFSNQVFAQQTDFLVKPYLQVGKTPSVNSLQLLWHTTDATSTWSAEYKNFNSSDWIRAEKQTSTKISITGIENFWVYSTSFTTLTPGTLFTYRVLKNGTVVFTSEAKSLKGPEQSYRVAITGDIAAGTKQAGRIANDIYHSNPDLIA